MVRPNTCRFDTETEPDGVVQLVNQLDAKEGIQSAEELRGQRGHREVQTLDAEAGNAEQNMPTKRGAQKPPREQRQGSSGSHRHADIGVVGACRRPPP